MIQVRVICASNGLWTAERGAKDQSKNAHRSGRIFELHTEQLAGYYPTQPVTCGNDGR